jgi:hypothetical protein
MIVSDANNFLGCKFSDDNFILKFRNDQTVKISAGFAKCVTQFNRTRHVLELMACGEK